MPARTEEEATYRFRARLRAAIGTRRSVSVSAWIRLSHLDDQVCEQSGFVRAPTQTGLSHLHLEASVVTKVSQRPLNGISSEVQSRTNPEIKIPKRLCGCGLVKCQTRCSRKWSTYNGGWLGFTPVYWAGFSNLGREIRI